MAEEVGKVSLGLELNKGDIDKQLGAVASKVGASFSKPLQDAFASAFKQIDMKSLTSGIGDAVKQSISTGAEQAIDSVQAKLNDLKAPSFLSKMFPKPAEVATPIATPAMVTPSTPKQSTASRVVKPSIDTEGAKSQISQLEQVLDNVNAKIEVQQRKLSDLKDSYDNTFNDAKKTALQEKIVNVEGTLLRLTKQSDSASEKIWKLEDSLTSAANEAVQTAAKVEKVAPALTATGKSLKSVKNNFDETAKAATKTGQSVAKAGKESVKAASAVTATGKPLKSAKSNFNAAAKAATKTGQSFSSTGKASGKMGNQFTQAFGRIAKQVLVFAVLYKAIRGVQDYMHSSMMTNQEYVNSLNAVKTNLATAFQPVFSAVMPAINSFMSWLAKATAYIAAFMSSLFGTSYKQSFAAAKGMQNARKEMDGFGKSAKKAGKEVKGLSALDDFNLIKTQDDPDSSGGGGGADPNAWNMEMPDLDIDGIQTKTDTLVANMKTAFNGVWESMKGGWKATVNTFGPTFAAAWGLIKPEIDKWKLTFQGVFNDIMALGAPLKDWIINSLVPAWQNGILVAAGIISGLSETVRLVFESIWKAVYPIIELFVTQGLPRIMEFVTEMHNLLGVLFGVVKQIFDDLWQGVVDPVMQLISKIIKDELDIIFGWWDTWGKDIMAGLKKALDGIKTLWTNLWENFLKPFVDNMLKTLTWLWDKHLKALVKEIATFVGKLIKAAVDIFNDFILPLVNFLVKILGPTFANIFSFIGDVLGTAIGVIADVAKGIIKALGGVIDFIAGVFTGDFKRAWNGIATFFEGIVDGIVGIFKGAVNLIVDALNFLIRMVNNIKIDVPSWLGKIPGIPDDISSLGFNIPEIPKLAKGGLATAPTLAMVGDNKNASVDPEVIAPLSKLKDMLEGSGNSAISESLLMSMLEVLKEIAKKNPSLVIGETELGRATTRSSNKVNRMNGGTALEI